MSLNQTPQADRLHIGIFGKTNSGKSAFINAFAGQQISIVSDVEGTTTDLVYKAMEISSLGACVLIDTAGFGDVSILGESRIERTKLAAQKVDMAILLFSDTEISEELEWYNYFKKKNIPVICVLNKADVNKRIEEISGIIKQKTGQNVYLTSAITSNGIDEVKDELVRMIPQDFGSFSITQGLVSEEDVVLLVMPQDIQAPKGRLILPQVQTIRELLEKRCVVICTTTDKMTLAIQKLKASPKLIITDSQVFRYVYDNKPEESMLTSFSVLFAAYKGDLPCYIKGARYIDSLTENSNVLIAECCTHAPATEDIGRVKIPNMLKKRFGDKINVEIKSGTDYPKDLTKYDLIIQCGACMFNRKYVLSRIEQATEQNVPITNYGVVIAHLTGILENITLPSKNI